MLHINKVAELMGVTVRTLRYYDKVGLIRPAAKTEGGHRLYAAEEFFDWNLDSKKHIILMGDAPAHETPKGTKKYTSELVMSRAQQKNIDIHCILLPME